MKVRMILAGLLASLTALGTATAADLSRPMITKAPPPPPPLYNWTGFYAGVNVGGSWGHQDSSLVNAAGTTLVANSLSLNGVIGGGQIGYNWQGIGSPWVFGLEADIQGSGQKADGTFVTPNGALLVGNFFVTIPGNNIAYQDKLEWFGTVRGRIGYAIGDQGRWLPYITGGLAYGDGNINGSGNVFGGAATAFNTTTTYVGWTVGAGIEWAFWDKWSAKLEYLYMDLGNGPTIALSPVFNLTTGRMTDNIARVGANLHF